MNKSRLEIKVGLFVLIGLVLMAALLIAFSKGNSLFRDTYTVNLRASNVGGLKQHATVLLAGVQVGSVNDIQLAPDGKTVKIILQIYKTFPIYHDARFVIESAGFLGDQFVSVIPVKNEDPKLANGDEVNCQEPFNLQEVARSTAGFIKRLDETAKKLDASVSDLRAKVLNAETLGSFGTAVTNLQYFTEQAVGTVQSINGIIATNGSQIGVAVSNAVLFSAELTRLAGSAQNLLDTNGATLTAATRNIQDASVSIKQIAADVQDGKGLAGTLLQNPQLATNVQQLAGNLSITSSNLNRLGLWGILWSHEPAGTNARPHSATKLNTPRNQP